MLNTSKEMKAAVSGLRRELKQLMGDATPSHTNCMELLARALGQPTYAALLTKLSDAEGSETPAATIAPKEAPRPKYPLRNDKGQYDLVGLGEKGSVVDGLDFMLVSGTREDIPACTAYAEAGRRDANGKLIPEYYGSTDVNWDAQVQRSHAMGGESWLTGNEALISSHSLIVVPEDFPDLFDEEDALDLPNREALLDAYVEYAVANGLVKQLQMELPAQRYKSRALNKMTEVLGFCLHYGELVCFERMMAVR